MNRDGYIDFRILEAEPVPFDADDGGEIALETADSPEGAELETENEEPADLEAADEEESADLECGDAVIIAEQFPVYDGPVTVVPSQREQVLETKFRSVMDRITVAPIPQNYGLITYNGRTITVS